MSGSKSFQSLRDIGVQYAQLGLLSLPLRGHLRGQLGCLLLKRERCRRASGRSHIMLSRENLGLCCSLRGDRSGKRISRPRTVLETVRRGLLRPHPPRTPGQR